MAQTISCPYPSNINPLQSNGFQFSITKLPELTFFAQEVNIPGLSLPSPEMGNPFANAPVPGDKLEFDNLNVQFLIDENMDNYLAIHSWMIALGFPQQYEQYRTRFAPGATAGFTELARNYSDATLQILNSSNNPIRTIAFRDLFPIGLQTVTMQSTSTDTQYVIGNATFAYTYYEFV